MQRGGRGDKQGRGCVPEQASQHQALDVESTRNSHHRMSDTPENDTNYAYAHSTGVDTALAHMRLDDGDHHLERKSHARVEAEGAALPRFKCRWAPLPSHIDSSQVCQLLCPPPGIREIMIRKGITPRNHCKDNRDAVAQRSALNHATRQAATSVVAPPPPVKIVKPKPESQPIRKDAIDFVAKNMKDAAHVPARRVKGPQSDCHKLKENFGKIPSYLIKRKIELAQEMERKSNENKSPQLPPGYVEMDEDEKNEVLKALRENKALLEKKLGALPLVCDTPSQIRARSNMDLEVQDIENAIKRFSRPHVYISLND